VGRDEGPVPNDVEASGVHQGSTIDKVKKQIIANVDSRQTRVAIVEDGRLAEVMYEKEENVVGNIYLCRVQDVVAGLDAAFVDCGIEKNVFLHVSDAVVNGSGGRKGRNRGLPPISKVIHAGDEFLVQVTKGPLESKGARATRNISLPGRYLVLMTDSNGKVGVSKKIDDEGERARLRKIAGKVCPSGFGIIVRTRAQGAGRKELDSDIQFLGKLWKSIQGKVKQAQAPALIHQDLSLVFEVVRDVLSAEVDEFIIDDKVTYDQVLNLLDNVAPDLRGCVQLYRSAEPIFAHYDIEEQIDKALRSKVWLPHGGFINIDQTEALTSIDVNTGKFTGTGSLEETVLRTNLDATEEIARQLRLRDIGGIIVIDFIDMDKSRHRKRVSAALREAFAEDRMHTRIMHITRLGLVEMTRKRTEENLSQKLQTNCPCCRGSGKILAADTVAMRVIQQLRSLVANDNISGALVIADPIVSLAIVGPHGNSATELEEELGIEMFVRASEEIHPEHFEIKPSDPDQLRQEYQRYRVGDVIQITPEQVLPPPQAGLVANVNGYIIEVPEVSPQHEKPLEIRLVSVHNSYGRGTPR